MTARTIMIQGTGSGVGKSVITAALCHYFNEMGFRVAPFKSQNMSNNSFVTVTGGEIGRAQAFQALAGGVEPTVDMNPILLKPSSETGSQVIVRGKAVATMTAREYHRYQSVVFGTIQESLTRLLKEHDVVVIEGAGSPAEINLRPYDIANMCVARMAAAPVLIVGDISLGGVFASLVGTLQLLTEEEQSLVKGLLINKFRGDISLLDDGLQFLKEKTGKAVLGVLPFIPDLLVAEEDCIPESKWRCKTAHDPQKLQIEVVLLPHISNSTDFEFLDREPDVFLRFLTKPPVPIEPLPDLLILPGSKSTIADLSYVNSVGFARYIGRCREALVPIAGVCGGYQMLGRQILDPLCVESSTARSDGLGLLDVTTTFASEKTTRQIRATSIIGECEVSAYEIHNGQTTGQSAERPLFHITEELGQPVNRLDGARSNDDLVWGTYLHGLFELPVFRCYILNTLRQRRGWLPIRRSGTSVTTYDFQRLSDWIRGAIDTEMLDYIMSTALKVG